MNRTRNQVAQDYVPVPMELVAEFDRLRRFLVKCHHKDLKSGQYLRVYCSNTNNVTFANWYNLIGKPKKRGKTDRRGRTTGMDYLKNQYKIQSVEKSQWSPDDDGVSDNFVGDLMRSAHLYHYNAKVVDFFRRLSVNNWWGACLLNHKNDTEESFRRWLEDGEAERQYLDNLTNLY